MSNCLTPDQLERLVTEQLDENERSPVSAHVEKCSACQNALQMITTGWETDKAGQPDPDKTQADRVARLFERLRVQRLPLRQIGPHDQFRGGQDRIDSQPESGEDNENKATVVASPVSRSRPTIDGFRIIREIGRGGMGIVYEAVEEKLNRRVALKILPDTALRDASQVRRFEREAMAAARLHHTNIVPVFGVGQQDGYPYYVMQYIEGSGLDAVCRELRRLRQTGTPPHTPQLHSRVEAPDATETKPEAHDIERSSNDAADIARSMVTGTMPNGKYPGAPQSSAIDDGSGSTLLFPAPFVPSEILRPGPPPSIMPGSTESLSQSELSRAFFLSVARIGLQVAQAIDYANHLGVLHRDIKPSNLLLDAMANVWVADFGLAKMTEADDLTQTGQVVGTIRYMAPERFQGQCDPRSDIYSLGLTLYEMVALRPAFQASDRHELMERVRSGEPAPLKSLAPRVPRDLETIINKAIAREPERRYATASALAEDLGRFLDGRAIMARRLSRPERVVRWCRRYPWVAAFLATLIVGVILSTWQAVRARLAERMAQLAEIEARGERDRAESEAATATALNEFVKGDLLAQASSHIQAGPATLPDPDLKVRTALDRAAEKIGKRFADRPIVEASIRHTIGEAYYYLGLYAQALQHLERARQIRQRQFGENHPATLDTVQVIGTVYLADGKLSEAEPLLLQGMNGFRAARGAEDPLTLAATHAVAQLRAQQENLGAAEEILLRLVDSYQRTKAPDSTGMLEVTNSLATIYEAQMKSERAEQLLKPALKIANDELGALHPSTLTIKNNLAMSFYSQGKRSDAEQALTEVLEAKRTTLGAQHPETLYAMSLLGHYDVVDGKLEEAEPMLVEALAGCRKSLDRNHEITDLALASLAELYARKRDLKKLGPVLIEAYQITRTRHGPANGNTLTACLSAGLFFMAQGEPAQAEPYFRERLAHFPTEPVENPQRLMVQCRLGQCLVAQAKYANAEPLLLSAYAGLKPRERGADDPNQAERRMIVDQLTRLYQAWGNTGKARSTSTTQFNDLVFPEQPFALP
jgi:eukaryotic-like serine/threonine-protein kinase